MRISIAMCTYNGARYLREQLASIAAQTLLPDELIVSDDGSTDQTLEIVREFATTVTFAVAILENKVNLGYSRNFDQAVQYCSHEMIALADQDDIWYPAKLEVLRRRLIDDETIGGVFSDGDLIDSDSRQLGRTLWQSFFFGTEDQARFNAGEASDVLLRRNVVTGMAFVFRGSMKHLLASVPPTWIHDGWLALQIARRSRLVAEPKRLVGYRVHGSQQVGAPTSASGKLRLLVASGFAAYVDAVHQRNLDEYQRTLLQFDDLVRFLQNADDPSDGELIANAKAKAAYARLGARALSMPRHKRWPLLLRHIQMYRSYSPTGLRGLLRDLFI